MEITQKDVNYFNVNYTTYACNWKQPSFNEEYNKQMGIPSLKKWDLMFKVKWEKHGQMKGKISLADIKNYKETFEAR